MNARRMERAGEVKGRVDAEGRLVEADPALAELQAKAGGRIGGMLAVPQIAALARLARRLGITISRAAIVAAGERDLDIWVRAEPAGEGIALAVGGWTERAPFRPAGIPVPDHQSDYLRAAADWHWETDESLALTSISPASVAVTGKPPAEWTGKPLTSLFRFREQEDGSLPILAALAEHRRFDDQLAELRTGTGELHRLSGVPLIDGTGRFAGFRGSASSVAGSLRDIVANDEAPPPAAGAAPLLGEHVGAALRGPIGRIIAQAEGIGAAEDGPLEPNYAGYAADIAAAGRHLLSLVEDMVEMQAVERADFSLASEPVDLSAVARQVASLLEVRSAEHRVRIAAPPDPAVARGEERRIRQILLNMVGNAVRYSPPGAEVRVMAGVMGKLAFVTVADEGRGIAPEDQGRIFDKFERVDSSEPGGTGLGLYISRRLARAMGGDISLVSTPGRGARFTLTLPAG